MKSSFDMLLEATGFEYGTSLTKEERDELPDEEFGIPSRRAYPLHDREHVVQAIKMFHYCPEVDRKELATNIAIKALKFKVVIGHETLVWSYIPKRYQKELIKMEQEMTRRK